MISVIIPIYNVEEYLEKCLKSILLQTYKNIEVILVNDGSTDSSLEICKKYSKIDNRIIIINKKNEGVSSARNNGLKIAKGDYVIFIDPDDSINENMLQILYNNINKANDIDISICGFERIYPKHKKEKEVSNKKYKIIDKELLLKEMLGKENFQGYVWNKLYKKSIINKYQIRFNEKISVYEDFLFNSEYINKIHKGIYSNQKLYYYYQRNDSAYNGKFNPKWLSISKAYEEIFNIYKANKLENYIGLKYNYLILNLDLKEKIIKSREKYEIKNINRNINNSLNDILSSNFITKKEKIKLLLKAKFMNIFIILKNIKNKDR